MPTPAPDPAPAPAAPDPERQRARNRRLMLVLFLVVVALALFTFAYVCLFNHSLRESDQPPSVLAQNPRVYIFETVFVGCVLLVLGFAFSRLVKRRP